MTAGMERTVTITATANGFDVVVSPDVEGYPFTKSYASYPEARGYGRGLKLYKGWALIDTTDAGNG